MIKWIVMAVIGLIILGYLGFDIRKAIDAPVTQTNLEYAKEAVSFVWTKYLSKPAVYLWREVFIKLIWEPAINNLKKKQDNKVNYKESGNTRFLFYRIS